MPAERITAFTGQIPRNDRRLLPASAAQEAINALLTSGRIDPVFTPKEVVPLSITRPKTIYRMYDASAEYWLAFENDVNVCRAIVADDTTFRVLITGEDRSPSQTNIALATSGVPYPFASYVLGVFQPITAPTVVVVGGAAAKEFRSYVYTFVTQWDEESAPSPASDPLEGFIDGSWNLSNMDVPPPNSYAVTATAWALNKLTLTVATTYGLRVGEYVTLSGLAPIVLNDSWRIAALTPTTIVVDPISDPGPITVGVGTATRDSPHNTAGMKKRIYRSVTTANDTNFYFVAEIPGTDTTYSDTIPADELGEELITSEWFMPPADMKGVVMHPSGSAVGFTRNTLHFSEPSAPYAYPPEYQQSVDADIVGIGVIGQSIVVCTKGRPWVCSGVDPAAMSMIKREQPWPCLAKRGIVPTTQGVLFPTPLGLAIVGSGGEDIWTRKLFSQVEWEDVAPETFTAAQFDDRYFAVTMVENDNYILVISGEWGVSRIQLRPSAIYTDLSNGKLYFAYDGKVWEWNASGGERLTAEWHSKEFVVPAPISLGAARVEVEPILTQAEIDAINAANAAIIAANQAILLAGTTKGELNSHMLGEMILNDDTLTPLTSLTATPLQFVLYVDNQVFYSRFITDALVFRLPGRVEYDNFSVRVSSQRPVRSIVIGDSPAALKTA